MQYLSIALCLFAVALQCQGYSRRGLKVDKRDLDMSVIGASCENAMDSTHVGKYFGGVIEGKYDDVSSDQKNQYLHGLKCAIEKLLGRLGIDVHQFEEKEEGKPERIQRHAADGLDKDAIFASCDNPNTMDAGRIGAYFAGVVEGKYDDVDASKKNAFLHGLRCAIEKLMGRLGIDLEDF